MCAQYPINHYIFLCIGECKGRALIYTRTRALKIFKQKAKNWKIGGNVFICIFFKFAASQVTATIQHVSQAHMTALGSSWNVPRKCKNKNGEKYNLQNAVSWTDKLVAGLNQLQLSSELTSTSFAKQTFVLASRWVQKSMKVWGYNAYWRCWEPLKKNYPLWRGSFSQLTVKSVGDPD